MSRQFQRRIENFTCAQCGLHVQGDGYTNHCPRCLWSRHVDEHPGDRQAQCGGMMQPVAVDGAPDSYRILHRCRDCGLERWNRSASEDHFEALVALAEAQGGPSANNL